MSEAAETNVGQALSMEISKFGCKFAGVFATIRRLERQRSALVHERAEKAHRLEAAEAELAALPLSRGSVPLWVEVLVLVIIALGQAPLAYIASLGFLIPSVAATAFLAFPLAWMPSALGYWLAREADHRDRQEGSHWGLVLAGIGLYVAATWLLRWNYYLEADLRYGLPAIVVAGLLTALAVIGLIVAYVIGRHAQDPCRAALESEIAALRRRLANISVMLVRVEADLQRAVATLRDAAQAAARRTAAELGQRFPGCRIPAAEEIADGMLGLLPAVSVAAGPAVAGIAAAPHT